MTFLYQDLLFSSNKTDNYIMELCTLPQNINLRCNDIKDLVTPIKCKFNNDVIYIPLSCKFDIFFNIQSFTNADYIVKQELCYGDEFTKIIDINLNSDVVVPLYIYQYTPFYIKLEFDDVVYIPEEIEIIYSTGLLQTQYKNNKNIVFPIQL